MILLFFCSLNTWFIYFLCGMLLYSENCSDINTHLLPWPTLRIMSMLCLTCLCTNVYHSDDQSMQPLSDPLLCLCSLLQSGWWSRILNDCLMPFHFFLLKSHLLQSHINITKIIFGLKKYQFIFRHAYKKIKALHTVQTLFLYSWITRKQCGNKALYNFEKCILKFLPPGIHDPAHIFSILPVTGR